jgi:hypothetical protein
LIQVLSSSHVRALVAGDQSVIATLPIKLPALAKLKGQDVRTLLRRGEMNFTELLTLAIELSKPLPQPMNRELPDWVKDSLELQTLAHEFSDMQLTVLGGALDISIRRECELKCSFLRLLVLAESTIDSQKKLTDITDPETFKQCVVSQQEQFLQVAREHAVSLAGNLTNTYNTTDIPVLSTGKTDEPSINFLIRKYVPDYRKSPLTPIPSDPKRRQQLLECALRNSALNGDYMDLVALILEVTNINATGELSGKTALHCAAIRASKTGERLCFDTLAKLPGIDFRVKDKEDNTVLDLWDFKQCPDDELTRQWKLQRGGETSTAEQSNPVAQEDKEHKSCLLM